MTSSPQVCRWWNVPSCQAITARRARDEFISELKAFIARHR